MGKGQSKEDKKLDGSIKKRANRRLTVEELKELEEMTYCELRKTTRILIKLITNQNCSYCFVRQNLPTIFHKKFS